MTIVDRWLSGRFLRAYLVFGASSAFLFLVIDLFANVDSMLKQGLGRALVERYGTMLPELFFSLSPHLVLLAGVWTVVSLIRSNELVPLYVAGYSPRRVSLPLLLTAAALGGLAWADRELLLPRLADLRRARKLLRQPREPLRPVPDGSGGVLAASYYMPSQAELVGASFVQLDPEGREALTIQAARAVWEPGAGWRFFEGVRLARAPGADPAAPIETGTVVTALPPGGLLLETPILLRDIEASVRSPSFLSAAQLREQIARSPAFRGLEVQLYERFVQPLAGVALLFLALPVMLAAAREGSLYLRGLACVGLGVVYFFSSAICFELGSRGALPAPLAAGLPLGVACGVGLFAFSRA